MARNRKLLVCISILLIVNLACGISRKPVGGPPEAPSSGVVIGNEPSEEAVVQPGVVPSEEVESTVESIDIPEATPEITVVQGEELVSQVEWSFQDPDFPTNFNYVLSFSNPNGDLAVINAEYQVIAYDASDRVLASADLIVPVLYPGEKTYVSGYSISLPEGVTADHLEVIKRSAGEARSLQGSNPLVPEKVRYYPDEYNATATGLIRNTSQQESISNYLVTGVAFNAAGAVVGTGSSTYNGVLPAEAVRPVQLTMSVSEEPSEVLFFPFVDYAWGTIEAAAGGDSLELIAAGATQNEYNQVGVGLIARNPTEHAFSGVSYKIGLFDADGFLLNMTYGSLPYIFPAEQVGGNTWSSIPEGTTLDHVEVYFDPVASDAYDFWDLESFGINANPFSATSISFFDDQYSPKVTAMINNAYTGVLSAIVSAVVYDASGVIIGGGTGYVSDVAGGSSAAVEIYLTFSGKVDKVELYPIMSGAPTQ
jgi:hypothetical protein